jgi:type VI secretion system protein ImpC
MAEKKQENAAQAQTQESVSLLEQAIGATKHTERSRAEELLAALTEQALDGTVTFDKNLSKSIEDAIKKIDETVSKQLTEIMHAEEFLKLEGSWRGVHHMIKNTTPEPGLKFRIFNANKQEIFKDLTKNLEFDQSEIYKKLYEDEFGTPGGEPYGVLLGDYEFANTPKDIEFLTKISEVAAAAFCPFISAASDKLLGFDSWEELMKPKDLEKITNSVEYTAWRNFRDTEDSRFVTLTMPRVLARVPYGSATNAIDEFDFEEAELDKTGKSKKLNHNQYCWMNAAYVLATRMANSFSEFSWPTSIRGAEAGGKITGLPTHAFKTDDGDMDMKCPTEVAITDRREAELAKIGLMPLSHYKNTDYAVFFGAQTTNKPKNYDDNSAKANAEISARLPYMLITSRIAHYLKVMARDKIGSMMEAGQVESWLNQWLLSLVNTNSASSQELKFKFPLAEAKVEVKEIPGRPGSFNAVAWMKPWLAMEELTTSLRLVAEIPAGGGSGE